MRYRRLSVLAVLLVAGSFCRAEAKILARWVELGPDGTSSVRAIVDDACPAVTFDGVATPMAIRAAPDTAFANVKPWKFPVTSCEAAIPVQAKGAQLEGARLPLPRATPQRIVIFGDTGCRLEEGVPLQRCNDPKAWPFPQIVKAAAAKHPDLVIHVGDYEYRESPCPSGNSGCNGSPFGYGWDAWNADFFAPAAPLFAAAPWVMARGNHEDCARAAEGWLRFLDRTPMATACQDLSGIFVAQLGKMGFLVVDSGAAGNPKTGADEMIARLRAQLQEVAAKVPGETWLVTHRPPDALQPGRAGAPNYADSTVQEKAFAAAIPAGVRMYVSGHIHFFQADSFGGTYPAQLVVGTGGDDLADPIKTSLIGADVNGHKITAAAAYTGFAYIVWDRHGADWSASLYDVGDKVIERCRLSGRSLTC